MEPQPKTLEQLMSELSIKFDNYVVLDTNWKKEDKTWKTGVEAWQEKVQPDIDSVTNTKTWGKITIGIITIGGIILTMGIELLKIIKKAL